MREREGSAGGGSRHGPWWVLGLSLQLLRRSLPETLVWGTTAAALLLRCTVQSRHLGGSAASALTAIDIFRDWLPIGALAWQVGLREGLLWQLAPLLPTIFGPPVLHYVFPSLSSSWASSTSSTSFWASMGMRAAAWMLLLLSLGALVAFPPVPFPPLGALAHRGLHRYHVGLSHGEEEASGDDPSGGTKKRAFYVWYPSSPVSSSSLPSSSSSGGATRISSSSSSSRWTGATRQMNNSASTSSSSSSRGHYFPSYKSQMELMFESMAYRLPTALIFSHLRHVSTDAAPDAPYLLPDRDDEAASSSIPSENGGGWPVIVFSHGLYGFPTLYSHLCSSLASLGYVVLAIGHTDGSGYIVSPTSGEVVSAFEPLPTSPSGREISGPELWEFRNRQLEVRIDDIEAALGILRRWNSDPASTFHETLDLERVAVAGHSFGGGTSLGLALRQAERRAKTGEENDDEIPVKAVILLDGWMYPLRGSDGPAFDKTIAASTFESSVPALFINAEMWQGSETYFRLNKERIQQLCRLSNGRWHSFMLRGSGHHNWNDFPFYTPMVSRLVGLVRELDIGLGHEYTIALADTFLSQTIGSSTSRSSSERENELNTVNQVATSLGPDVIADVP